MMHRLMSHLAVYLADLLAKIGYVFGALR